MQPGVPWWQVMYINKDVEAYASLGGGYEFKGEQLNGSPREREFVEAGPKNLQMISIKDIRLLEQPRRSYDQKEVESLAWAMVENHAAFEAATTIDDITAAIDIYHTPILNRVSISYLDTYLTDHGTFYSIPTPALHVDQGEEAVYINSGGHTRYLAYAFLLKAKGLTIEDGKMLCQVRDNMTHAETLAIQLRENKKSNPKPQDIAYIIERLAHVHEDNYRTKPTVKYLSAYTGLSEDVVSDGLAFTSLPREIQDYVGDPRKERVKRRSGKDHRAVVPYSMLTRFKPFQLAVTEKFNRDNAEAGEDERQEHVTRRLHQLAKKIAKLYAEGTSPDKISTVVTAEITTAQDALKAEQQDLIFIAEAYDEGVKHRNISNQLAERCVATLLLMAEQGHLSDALSDDLQQVIELQQRSHREV